MQKKLTEGNITKNIILFMLPVLVGNGLQRVYTLVDTVMVGRLLGTAQLAAVGSSSVIANLFIDLCSTFTAGFSIIIAQFYGANDNEKLKKSMAATYLLSFLIAIFLTIMGFFLLNPIIRLTKVPEDIIPLSKEYLHIMIGGLIFTLIYNMMTNVLRALGDSSVPLFFLVTSVLLNVFLDYITIRFFGWGVFGVAASTIFSQGLAGCCCIIFCLFKRKIMSVKISDFKAGLKIYKMIVSQGISMALMLSVVSLSTLVLQIGINSLGTTMIAGYMAGRKYLEIFLMPGFALSLTAANFVSQNYGAKEYTRIKKGVNQMLYISYGWAAISLVIIFMFARQIIMSVTGSEVAESLIQCGIDYLKIGVVFFIPVFILCIIRSCLQSMNHKKAPVFSSCIELLVKIIAVLIIIPKLEFTGICITEPIIWCINALWLYPVYLWRIHQMTA